jgi:hypothetical protein
MGRKANGFSNGYDLHISGMKITHEFRDFLKEIGG